MNNILMISIDTPRTDRLSCYGYPRITSPNLDLLAKESFVFENCIFKRIPKVRKRKVMREIFRIIVDGEYM